MDVVDASPVLIPGLAVSGEAVIVLSAPADGWTLSLEVKVVVESADCVVKVFCTVAGIFVAVFVVAVGAVTISTVFVAVTAAGTVVPSTFTGGSVAAEVIVSIDVAPVKGDVKPTVDVEGSVVLEFSMLTVTFASCSILDRSKP